MSGDGDHPVLSDLEIIEASYRCAADPAALDEFLERCGARLDEQDLGTQPGLLERQLKSVASLLSRMPDPSPEDEAEAVLRQSRSAAVLINAAGSVSDLNEEGALMFGARRGAEARGSWLDPGSEQEYERLLRMLRPGANRAQVVLRITKPSGEAGMAEGFVAGEAAQHVLIRALSVEWTGKVAETLSSAFDLTAAEIDVSRMIFEGKAVEEIAAERQSAPRTVRTQLRSIFAKTGMARQLELNRLLNALAARSEQIEGATGRWRDPLGREKIVRAPDGRAIALTFMGQADGYPVLLTHGAFTGYMLPEQVQHHAKKCGLNLIVVMRPGFGNSDPLEREGAITAGARSLKDVCDILNIERCSAIGLMNGLTPIARFASQDPALVEKVLSIGAAVPLKPPIGFSHLPGAVKTMLRLASIGSVATEVAALASLRLVRSKGMAEGIVRMFGHSEPDRRSTSDPRTLSLMAASASMLSAQGHATFTKDLGLIAADWREDLRTLQCPVRMLCGEQDPVYPPAKVKAVQKAYPTFEIETVPDAGQLVMYQAGEPLLRALDWLRPSSSEA
nr:LuxR C-terminal-related transcriptional regulator [Parvularcula maris]